MSEFNTFSALALPEPILRAISELGFETPTPIQQQSIPALLEDKNVLGEAQTGTGKTAAFGLPALTRINVSQKAAQLLVVAPTRELAIQVAEQIQQMARFMKGLEVATIYGGAGYGPQVKSLRQGAQVVVGTPGRLMDHIRKGTLKLDKLTMSVLDEADEMLNMGFLEDIEWIMEQVPEGAQRALFSATMPPQIRKIANRFLADPVHVKIAQTNETKANIEQKAWKVAGMDKMTGLERILETTEYNLVLIFVRTRQDTLDIAESLQTRGFKAAGLNGDMNQAQREATVAQLKSGKIRILVATDVVARGLDVPGVTHVINYDLPQDTESYVHRIGRTGRAGRSGEAILFARAREMYLLKRYEKATSGQISMIDVPSAREVTKFRIEAKQERLKHLVENSDLSAMQSLLTQMSEATDLTMEQIAAALLYEQQRTRPLIVKDEPRKFKTERAERPARGDRRDRGAKPARKGGKRDRRDANVDFETYRIAVGKEHGARPGDIVGAIANEANMDSSLIGSIKLFGRHSTVELPKGLPSKVVQKLQKTRVRQQAIALTPEGRKAKVVSKAS